MVRAKGEESERRRKGRVQQEREGNKERGERKCLRGPERRERDGGVGRRGGEEERKGMGGLGENER